MRHMTIEFTYTVAGGERDGILAYADGLLGPIAISPDEESCYTFCGGYSRAGSNAVFLRQEIDAPVEFRVLPSGSHQPEELLERFIDEWLPELGDLQTQVRALLADYLRRDDQRCPRCGSRAAIVPHSGVCASCTEAGYDRYCPR
jgi:hypothetical protein